MQPTDGKSDAALNIECEGHSLPVAQWNPLNLQCQFSSVLFSDTKQVTKFTCHSSTVNDMELENRAAEETYETGKAAIAALTYSSVRSAACRL